MCLDVQGLSIACSTPEAVNWDPSWANSHEISGRAMKNVHDAAEGFQYERRQERKEQRAADDCVGESISACRSVCTSSCISACTNMCTSICMEGAMRCQIVKNTHALHTAVVYMAQGGGGPASLVPATSVAMIGFGAECVSGLQTTQKGPCSTGQLMA